MKKLRMKIGLIMKNIHWTKAALEMNERKADRIKYYDGAS